MILIPYYYSNIYCMNALNIDDVEKGKLQVN